MVFDNAGPIYFMKRNAILFIDGSNWYHNVKSIMKPGKIDFKKLANFICNNFDLIIKEIRYYNSIPDIGDSEEVYYKHLEFLKNLEKSGIIVRTRKLKKIKKLNIKIEKGVDVLIASDMIRETLVRKRCEVCILISGDSDFITAMQIIKDSGFEAITCCVQKGHASELKEGKFRYLILKKEDLEKCLQ